MSFARVSETGADQQGAAALLLDQQAAVAGVRKIATGDLRDAVLSADGHDVLVADTSGVVTRYDLATGASTGSWQVGTSLGGMAISADGHYLYATELTPVTTGGYNQSNVAELDRLDLQTGAVTRFDLSVNEFSTSVFRDVATESNGDLLLTTAGLFGSGDTHLYTFDPQTGTASVTQVGYASGAYFGALQGTPDGNHILLTDIGVSSADIRLLTVDQGSTIIGGYGLDNQGTNGATAITADGRLVAQSASANGHSDVLVYDSALQTQADLHQLAPQAIGNGATGLAFSPDGAHLFLLNGQLNQVVELSTSTWATEAVIPVHAPILSQSYTYTAGLGSLPAASLGDTLQVSADGHYLTVTDGGSVQIVDVTQTTPTPVLTVLSFPTLTTVGPDGGYLFMTAGATDATSEVQSVTITLDHAIATVDGPETQITFSADHDAFDDTFSAVNLHLTGAAGGSYTVVGATVTDAAGHSVSYDAATLGTLLPATSFSVVSQVTLTDGDDTYHDTFGQGLTIHGLAGNDTLYGSSTSDTLDGGAGDDTLVQGQGATTFIGGDGVDTVVLNGNARDYYEVHSAYSDDIVLLARNGSATQTIAEDVEHVRFADGSLLSEDNLPDSDYSVPGTVAGDYVINAPDQGYYTFNGGTGNNEVFLPGTASDYTLSRGYVDADLPYYYYAGSAGDFDLTGKDGKAVYAFDESVDSIHFADGQYLALKDLPAYVSGSAALDIGSEQNDILFQSKSSGYEAFSGGAGHDDLYLKGNVGDYTARSFYGIDGNSGQSLTGVELASNNGSGALFIDNTVDTVHFQNGQYLAFNDVASYVAAAPATDAVFHLLGDGGGSTSVSGAAYAHDVLLLNGNVGDYSLQRDSYSGAFALFAHDGSGVVYVDQDVETVQFGNGQYLALKDLPAYVAGTAVFTNGTADDDLLFTAPGGDQYVTGGRGTDNLYLTGNTHDYTLQDVHLAAGYDYQGGQYTYHPQIDGVELVANNGSGNIFIDQSVETVHFQDGQYLAFNDLHAYIGS